MLQPYSQAYYTQDQHFNERFPLVAVTMLAIIQMLTTFSIVGLEIGHILSSIRLTNLFAGFWTSLPFTLLWISMFATVCCCRRRSCATHALVQNIISLIFAIVLIGINIAFLRRPHDCFFTHSICEELLGLKTTDARFECLWQDRLDDCANTRIALIKAQLAVGVVMAVTCVLYCILYCAIATQASRASRRRIPTPADAVMAPVYQPSATSSRLYQHQPYSTYPYSYQPSAPPTMFDPSAAPAQAAFVTDSLNYVPPNQESTIYPKIPHNRF